MAILIYGISFLFGSRIEFKGLVPILTVAIFITPVCIFTPEINETILKPLIGRRFDDPVGIWIGATLYSAIALAIGEKTIPNISIENFLTGLLFCTALGSMVVLLNIATN